MSLSKFERVLLMNVLITQKALAAAHGKESDPELSHLDEWIEILRNGYEHYYSEILNCVYDALPADHGAFVVSVLQMYRAIEHYKEKNPSDAGVVKHFAAHFRGFDGNYEGSYFSYAQFILDTQKQWQETANYRKETDGYNSHTALVPMYSRMLLAFQPLTYPLDKPGVDAILAAADHGDPS